MATLSDVAARVGVSKSTVSRALSRPELVAPATAERIRRAAQELNFVVNRAASGLATGRTGIVAIVVPNLDNHFFTPIIVGAQQRAEAEQRQLTIAANPLETDGQLRDLERLARQVDGVIVAAPGWDRVTRPAASSSRAATAISAGAATPRRKFILAAHSPGASRAPAWATAQTRSAGSRRPAASATASSDSRPTALIGWRTMAARRAVTSPPAAGAGCRRGCCRRCPAGGRGCA